MKRAKEHRIIWRRDWRGGGPGGEGGNTLGEKEGENEILTVEKEENLPWKKSEKQGGGNQTRTVGERIGRIGSMKERKEKESLDKDKAMNLWLTKVNLCFYIHTHTPGVGIKHSETSILLFAFVESTNQTLAESFHLTQSGVRLSGKWPCTPTNTGMYGRVHIHLNSF